MLNIHPMKSSISQPFPNLKGLENVENLKEVRSAHPGMRFLTQWTGEKLGASQKTETSPSFKALVLQTRNRQDCVQAVVKPMSDLLDMPGIFCGDVDDGRDGWEILAEGGERLGEAAGDGYGCGGD